MRITKHIQLDLVNRETPSVIDVMQLDKNSRMISVSLFENGTPWNPPADSNVTLSFIKPDKLTGWYDTLPDGSPACLVQGNVITVILVDAATQIAGDVTAALVFQDNDLKQLSTFPFTIRVTSNPSLENQVSYAYYRLSTLEQINNEIDSIPRHAVPLVGFGSPEEHFNVEEMEDLYPDSSLYLDLNTYEIWVKHEEDHIWVRQVTIPTLDLSSYGISSIPLSVEISVPIANGADLFDIASSNGSVLVQTALVEGGGNTIKTLIHMSLTRQAQKVPSPLIFQLSGTFTHLDTGSVYLILLTCLDGELHAQAKKLMLQGAYQPPDWGSKLETVYVNESCESVDGWAEFYAEGFIIQAILDGTVKCIHTDAEGVQTECIPDEAYPEGGEAFFYDLPDGTISITGTATSTTVVKIPYEYLPNFVRSVNGVEPFDENNPDGYPAGSVYLPAMPAMPVFLILRDGGQSNFEELLDGAEIEGSIPPSEVYNYMGSNPVIAVWNGCTDARQLGDIFVSGDEPSVVVGGCFFGDTSSDTWTFKRT